MAIKFRWDLIRQYVALGKELTMREMDAVNRIVMRPALRRIARAERRCAKGECAEVFAHLRKEMDSRAEALANEKEGALTKFDVNFTCSHGRLYEMGAELVAGPISRGKKNL